MSSCELQPMIEELLIIVGMSIIEEIAYEEFIPHPSTEPSQDLMPLAYLSSTMVENVEDVHIYYETLCWMNFQMVRSLLN